MPPRRFITLLSALVHAAILSTIFVTQLLSLGPLPVPRTVLAFSDALPVSIHDIPLPPPARGGPAPSEGPSPASHPSTRRLILRRSGTCPMPRRVASRPVCAAWKPESSAASICQATACRSNRRRHRQVRENRSGFMPACRRRGKSSTWRRATRRMRRLARIEGVVVLDAVIDATGRVTDVRVTRSIQALDQAAIDAVRQWRFTPTLLNGEPVSILLTVTVRFTLGPS